MRAALHPLPPPLKAPSVPFTLRCAVLLRRQLGWPGEAPRSAHVPRSSAESFRPAAQLAHCRKYQELIGGLRGCADGARPQRVPTHDAVCSS